MDNDIGTENLTFTLSNITQDKASATLSDEQDAHGNRGVVYVTEATPIDFSLGHGVSMMRLVSSTRITLLLMTATQQGI